MRNLSDNSGFLGYGETSWEAGGIGEASPGKIISKDLIEKANTVPLLSIFAHYNVRIDPFNMNICPFKAHKGGRESTPSFKFYKRTNSFYCYGCGHGHKNAHGCEFVSYFESISKDAAAAKILKNFPHLVITGSTITSDDSDEMSEEKKGLILDFSTLVRDFRSCHYDEKANLFIEDKCRIFDNMAKEHALDEAALCRVIDILKQVITSYTD